MDWMAAGLPTEGTAAALPTAGKLARGDAPTCLMTETVGQAAARAGAAGIGACVVVNDRQVVMGMLRTAQLTGDPGELVEKVMRPGPSTYRPFVVAAQLLEEMTKSDLPDVPVTTSDGRLVGLLLREDIPPPG